LDVIGITTNGAGTYFMAGDAKNIYGLPFLSAKIAFNAGGGSAGTTTLYAGYNTAQGGYFYPETAQPQFQTVEYDFWNSSPLPGSANFATTNTSDLLIVGVGSSIGVNGYAKLSVQNGYSGVYGYLGQYFDQAYQIDDGGNVTTNTTGVLSPYGSFFATQPGPAALVTMPDVDTGVRGTSTVYCVSMNVDWMMNLRHIPLQHQPPCSRRLIQSMKMEGRRLHQQSQKLKAIQISFLAFCASILRMELHLDFLERVVLTPNPLLHRAQLTRQN
jgi:hypothetical protein